MSVEDTQGDKATPRGDRESPEARKEGRQRGSLASGWKRCLERKPAVSRSGHTGAGGGAKLGLRISSGGELSLWGLVAQEQLWKRGQSWSWESAQSDTQPRPKGVRKGPSSNAEFSKTVRDG